jgi:hypothetical protein
VSEKDFTRKRVLTLEHTMGLTLSLSVHRNQDGYDLASQDYFRKLGRELGEQIHPATHQSISEARSKIRWQGFEYLLSEANLEKSGLAGNSKFHGHVTRGVDGTSLHTPRTAELLEHFSPRKTSSEEGETHYPYALCVAAVNVYTGQPTHAVVDDYKSSERDLLLKLLPQFNKGDLSLLDRGLGGVRVYFEFHRAEQFFLHRTKTTGERVALFVQDFLASGKKQQKLWIFLQDKETSEKSRMKVRLIRGPEDSEGKSIVFVTNLLSKKKYPRKEIIELYRERWTSETTYNRVKNLLNLEKFHAQSHNGVMQEIFANLLTLSLAAAAVQAVVQEDGLESDMELPRMKNAVNVIKRYLFAILDHQIMGQSSKVITQQILEEVRAVRYKKRPDRSYPRVSKQPIRPWNLKKSAKIRAFQQQQKRRLEA